MRRREPPTGRPRRVRAGHVATAALDAGVGGGGSVRSHHPPPRAVAPGRTLSLTSSCQLSVSLRLPFKGGLLVRSHGLLLQTLSAALACYSCRRKAPLPSSRALGRLTRRSVTGAGHGSSLRSRRQDHRRSVRVGRRSSAVLASPRIPRDCPLSLRGRARACARGCTNEMQFDLAEARRHLSVTVGQSP